MMKASSRLNLRERAVEAFLVVDLLGCLRCFLIWFFGVLARRFVRLRNP